MVRKLVPRKYSVSATLYSPGLSRILPPVQGISQTASMSSAAVDTVNSLGSGRFSWAKHTPVSRTANMRMAIFIQIYPRSFLLTL